MRIDFHTHIFPPPARKARETFFDAEPAFKLLYNSPKSRLVGARQLLKQMDACQIDYSVVFGFPWQNHETVRRHNDYILEAVARHPDRLVGLACLDPASKAAETEAERCLAQGLAGLGELAFYRSGIDERALSQLAPLMQLCRDYGRPVLIHTNEPVGHAYPGKTPITLQQIYALLQQFPENKIVLAHWGGGIFFFYLMKKQVKACLQNVYFDTAASPFLYDPAIYQVAADTVGIDKILFGSDYPLLSPDRYFKELEQTGLTQTDLAAVCGNNAAGLLQLKKT